MRALIEDSVSDHADVAAGDGVGDEEIVVVGGEAAVAGGEAAVVGGEAPAVGETTVLAGGELAAV